MTWVLGLALFNVVLATFGLCLVWRVIALGRQTRSLYSALFFICVDAQVMRQCPEAMFAIVRLFATDAQRERLRVILDEID